MSQMETIFLPAGYIALFFVIFWVIKYPYLMWHDMKMCSTDHTDNIVGLVTWCFVAISFMTVSYTAYKFIG